MRFNINLTSLAVILWSGMLIIAGSIWVLSSQVRKLADLFEAQEKAPARVEARGPARLANASARAALRRGGTSRVLRASVAVARNPATYPALPPVRRAAIERGGGASDA